MIFPESYQDRADYYARYIGKTEILLDNLNGRVFFPMGLRSFVKPIVDYGDWILHDFKSMMTATVHVTVERPWIRRKGYYNSVNNTINFIVYTYSNTTQGDKPVSGIEDSILNVVDANPLAGEELVACLTEGVKSCYFRDEVSYVGMNNPNLIWRIIITDWLSGFHEKQSWGIPTVDRVKSVRNLQTWLERYVCPTKEDVLCYGAIYIHERHHELMLQHAIQSGIYSHSGVYASRLSALLSRDRIPNESELPGILQATFTEDEFDQLSPVQQLQAVNTAYIKWLRNQHFPESSQWYDLVKTAVLSGCGEVIGHLINQTTSLSTENYFVSWQPAIDPQLYSIRTHYYPNEDIIDRWEDMLTGEVDELGMRLGFVYTDLFQNGVFEKMLQQATGAILS